jgi:hypothetical protein
MAKIKSTKSLPQHPPAKPVPNRFVWSPGDVIVVKRPEKKEPLVKK